MTVAAPVRAPAHPPLTTIQRKRRRNMLRKRHTQEAIGARRARVLAEAVVSAYVRELAAR